jgi:hypothetical protein
MLGNIHLIGSSSLPVAPLIDSGRGHSLAAWLENRFGPSGRAYAFWTPSNSAAEQIAHWWIVSLISDKHSGIGPHDIVDVT